MRRCSQQRRQALAHDGFDDAVRRLCFMGRYFWLGNNSREFFNLLNNDMYYYETQCSRVMLEMNKLNKTNICLPCVSGRERAPVCVCVSEGERYEFSSLFRVRVMDRCPTADTYHQVHVGFYSLRP